MWELGHKETWAPKNWCIRIVVLEKTLESPLDSKEIKPISPKGNQPWLIIRRTDAEAEASIHWPPDAKSQLTGKKDLMLGKIEGKRRRGQQDETVGWQSLTQWTWIWANSGRYLKDREAWRAVVHGVAKSWTRLNNNRQFNNVIFILIFILCSSWSSHWSFSVKLN